MKIPLIFVPSQRIENKWTSDRKKGVSVGSDSSERCGKRTVFGLKNKREKTFLPFKTQLFHIQIVRYAASKLKKTLPNDINQDDIFDYIKKHDLIEKVDLIEYDKIRQNLLL